MISMALGALLACHPVFSIPGPDASREKRVFDDADVLSIFEESQIEQQIDRMDRRYDVQVVVWTVDHAWVGQRAVAERAYHRWDLDDESEHSLLWLLNVDGRSLESVTNQRFQRHTPDDWLLAIQDHVMVPHFANGHYGDGLKRGLTELEGQFQHRFGPINEDAERPMTRPSAPRDASSWGLLLVLAGLVALFAVHPNPVAAWRWALRGWALRRAARGSPPAPWAALQGTWDALDRAAAREADRETPPMWHASGSGRRVKADLHPPRLDRRHDHGPSTAKPRPSSRSGHGSSGTGGGRSSW